MRIINIRNNRHKKLVIGYWLLVIGLVSGCVQINTSDDPEGILRQSNHYYQQAIDTYKELISQGKDLDRLYLELGQAYYSHGEFIQAQEAFKKSSQPKARKLLAVSYYQSGNFTDALEIFNRHESGDAESLYYQGLTCEKLNLYDQALQAYKKIKHDEFGDKAKGRIEIIEKQESRLNIKEMDPKVNRILQDAPKQEQYPQAGALILLCDEKIEVSPEDTQVATLHYLVKILNERGKEEFSETHIDYDSTYEKVELIFARTIKPDGKVTEVGSRHTRDVSKYLNFPLYSNARVFIVSFPEISEGASIEYKVKVYRNQLVNKKDFVLSYPVQSGEPIIGANFSLLLPKEKKLRLKTINEKYNNFAADLNPVIQEENNSLIYNWHFNNIPQIIPESSMPPDVQINPAILMSTFKDWDEVYNWWWGLAKDKIRADSSIAQKVKDLTKGKISAEDKIRAIHNFCAQKIRYVAVEYGQAGYEPHPAADIFKNKYGDCKDQAVLLITMLKEAGFKAYPVLIATKEYYNLNEDLPSVLFNHAIACVEFNGKLIFLDPTAETCPFGDLPSGDQARKVLIFLEDGFKILSTPLYPAGHNLAKQVLQLKVSDEETITAAKSIYSYGIYDQAQRYWLLYTQPELIEESLKEKIQEVSIGAKLIKYDIENLKDLNSPVVLNYEFQGPEYFTSAGDLRIMPQLAGIDTSIAAKDKRKYPIDFGILESSDTVFEMENTDNFSIKYLPQSINEESPWFKFTAEYKYKNNKLYFRQKTEVKKRDVSEAEYAEFKQFIERLAKKLKQRIVLEKLNKDAK